MNKKQMVQIPLNDYLQIIDRLKNGKLVVEQVSPNSDNYKQGPVYGCGYSHSTICRAIDDLNEYIK